MLTGQLREAGDVVQPDMQPVLEIQSVRDTALEQVLPVAGEPTALGGDPDEGGVRLVPHPLVDRADDRDAVVGLPRSLRVEDRHDGFAAVAHDSPQRLPVVRVVRELLSEDQVLLL